jgi:hypothetical protein
MSTVEDLRRREGGVGSYVNDIGGEMEDDGRDCRLDIDDEFICSASTVS